MRRADEKRLPASNQGATSSRAGSETTSTIPPAGDSPAHPPPADPGPPRRGRLFATRYVDHHGRTGSVLFRRRSSAERYAAHVDARGGTAAVYQSQLGSWSK